MVDHVVPIVAPGYIYVRCLRANPRRFCSMLHVLKFNTGGIGAENRCQSHSRLDRARRSDWLFHWRRSVGEFQLLRIARSLLTIGPVPGQLTGTKAGRWLTYFAGRKGRP